ncbi:MAG: DUF456 domain-containing protein [Bacteroidia bacterium]
MEIVLIIIGAILLLVSLAGCLLPVVPGPALGFISFILLQFAYDPNPFSTKFMIILAVVIVVVTILDYVVPALGAKKMGGTNAGKMGSTLGLVAGIIAFPPLGIIVGPFAGALLAELVAGSPAKVAWSSALGTFLGFISGTLVKIALCGVMIYFFIAALV